MKAGRRVALLVGEESGDARAAALVRELRALDPSLRFFGVGGPRLAEWCEEPFDNWISEAGVVGLWDVLKKYPWFRARFARLKSELIQAKPEALLFVDYPGFNLRLARALRPHLPATRFIYYISPQVWAWNRGRIPKMARFLDAMLCLFPFEVPLYESSGLPALCVGHPLAEELGTPSPVGESESPEKTRNASDGAPLLDELGRERLCIGLLPGSRQREVHQLFPVMLQAARIMLESYPDLEFQAAAARPALRDWMEAEAQRAGVRVVSHTGGARELMRRAAFAWVCSGTATLEAAFLGLPHAIVYRTSWLTYEVGRRLVRVPHLGMVNILGEREVVPEFIQHDCTPFALADCALRYLNNPAARTALAADLRQITSALGHPSESSEGPSRQAARAVLRVLDHQPLIPSC